MRCADFGPIPGKQRRASISPSRPDGFTGLERQFEARGQIHACRESGHLFLAQFLGAFCVIPNFWVLKFARNSAQLIKFLIVVKDTSVTRWPAERDPRVGWR